MKVLLQRVQQAQVMIDDSIYSQIGVGLLLFVGFGQNDGISQIDYLVHKIVNSRIFTDDTGKLNKSVQDINGEILSVSQFTLYADTKKGNRPSFTKALAPGRATILYDDFNQKLKNTGLRVQTGIFGADMQIGLVNDGPLTLMLER
ncbi:D-aminoacyl-tRNA deacylase [Bombilactobacillus thymidiniphilus]|uniref:D-aminoacyl-tRNA deacylase n=1 Tax=Bombilactobacillus thymidiniphilus TaxID=2923363 RepID=A0ABY4PD44_9LACO|nr:D-aminoacyl-tRNA deacylase [Bombilactobacillus thymidiniphilus]UQS83530.1 D-aminoacyl-tRNA deacylase [Bombilactobacillus thymidiniphilus]